MKIFASERNNNYSFIIIFITTIIIFVMKYFIMKYHYANIFREYFMLIY